MNTLNETELTEKKKRFKFLENELIDLISKTESDLLKDTFLDWMEIRTELNENSLNEITSLLENSSKKLEPKH